MRSLTSRPATPTTSPRPGARTSPPTSSSGIPTRWARARRRWRRRGCSGTPPPPPRSRASSPSSSPTWCTCTGSTVSSRRRSSPPRGVLGYRSCRPCTTTIRCVRPTCCGASGREICEPRLCGRIDVMPCVTHRCLKDSGGAERARRGRARVAALGRPLRPSCRRLPGPERVPGRPRGRPRAAARTHHGPAQRHRRPLERRGAGLRPLRRQRGRPQGRRRGRAGGRRGRRAAHRRRRRSPPRRAARRRAAGSRVPRPRRRRRGRAAYEPRPRPSWCRRSGTRTPRSACSRPWRPPSR